MYRAPRGTQDILPEDRPYWRHVTERAHAVAALYGYEFIDTPIFEETSLFVRGVGEGTDIVDKEMYSFQDKGGDDLTLRPEFTAGVMRAYLEHGMRTRPQPVKLYSFGPIFRREKPQAGRYRQFWQFNVEAIGEMDPALDVEVMSVAWQLYEDLGFGGLSFQINSTGDPRCRPRYIEALVAYYRQHLDVLGDDDRRRLERNPLRLLDSKVPAAQPVIAAAPKITDYLCDDCAQHFARVRRYLDELDRPYAVNHRLVRGLDYYTKTVFEVYAEGIGAQNAVCGGGRYDGLIEALGGPPTPGIGFATGIERIILTMKERGIAVPGQPRPTAFVAPLGEDGKTVALKLVTDLRAAGLPALLAFGDRSLKAQLRAADRAGATYAIILGEDELAQGQAALRHMAQGTQQNVLLQDVVTFLKNDSREQ
ncbi:MAG: histidine--tRNA ligase [Anaerolineae bacterium]|nr:histidine--tRNA ligase [Anaerolineae bacterium]